MNLGTDNGPPSCIHEDLSNEIISLGLHNNSSNITSTVTNNVIQPRPTRWIPRDSSERKKIRLTEEQREVLDVAFARDSHPSPEQRHHIAMFLNVSTRVVQVWFQNRRAKRRRDEQRHGNSSNSHIESISQDSIQTVNQELSYLSPIPSLMSNSEVALSSSESPTLSPFVSPPSLLDISLADQDLSIQNCQEIASIDQEISNLACQDIASIGQEIASIDQEISNLACQEQEIASIGQEIASIGQEIASIDQEISNLACQDIASIDQEISNLACQDIASIDHEISNLACQDMSQEITNLTCQDISSIDHEISNITCQDISSNIHDSGNQIPSDMQDISPFCDISSDMQNILPSFQDMSPAYLDTSPSYQDMLPSYLDVSPGYFDMGVNQSNEFWTTPRSLKFPFVSLSNPNEPPMIMETERMILPTFYQPVITSSPIETNNYLVTSVPPLYFESNSPFIKSRNAKHNIFYKVDEEDESENILSYNDLLKTKTSQFSPTTSPSYYENAIVMARTRMEKLKRTNPKMA